MTELTSAFDEIFPKWKDLNFGIILISVYYFLEFGSIQGLFPVISSLKIPLLISGISVGYAFFLFLSNAFDRKSGVTRSLFCLILFVVVYSLVGTDSSSTRTDLIKVCSIYYANYLIIVSNVKKVSQFKFILDVWLFSTAFSCYNGFFQGGLVWNSRWLNDENQIALLADMAFPFAFIFMVLHRSKLRKLYYLLSVFSYSMLNVVAHSRGGSLGFALAILSCFLVLKNKVRNFLFFTFFVIITLNYAPPIFFEDMATLEQGVEEGTADDRVYLWGIAIDMFSHNPVLGVGPMNYPIRFSDYEKGNRYRTGAQRVAHSTPIQYLAEYGSVGVMLFLLLQVQLYKNWKFVVVSRKIIDCKKITNRDQNYFRLVGHACIISQIAFHFCALFLSVFLYPFYWSVLPFSEVWKNICLEENDKKGTRM